MANQEPSTPNPETSTLPSILMRLFLSCELPYRYYVPGRWVVTRRAIIDPLVYYMMMRTRYIKGALTVAQAVMCEQNKPREKTESGVYSYVARKSDKVPSIPLEAGDGLFSVHNEEEFEAVVSRMSKRYVRRNMMSLFPFVQYFRQFCEVENYSIVYIPCHSQRWRKTYATPQEDGLILPVAPCVVQRAIKVAIKVGLLAVYQQGSFRKTAEGLGLCTKYLYSKRAEKWVVEKFKAFGITKADFQRVTRSATKARVRREMSDTEMMEKVKIGCGLNLPPLSDETVYRQLYLNYPTLRELGDAEGGDIKACNEIAEGISPELAKLANITAEIKIKRGKGGRITAIAFRPWSNAGIMKREDRKAAMAKMSKSGMNTPELDVKASIYQVTELCNKGIWRGNTYDEYQAMAGFAMSPAERKLYKLGLAQRLYFSKSDKSCMAHILALGRDVEDVCSRVDGWHVVQEARRRMFDAVGPFYGSEIFLHEAAIYVKALRKLLERGEKALLVYDCFYILDTTMTARDIEKVVRETAVEYYNKWFAGR